MSDGEIDPMRVLEDTAKALDFDYPSLGLGMREAIEAVRELVDAARHSQQIHGELCDADLPGSWDAWKRLDVALDPFNAALSEPQA